jgi:hypothetical protein
MTSRHQESAERVNAALYHAAVKTLRELEAKPVFAVLQDTALEHPAMMAAGILAIHAIDDDAAHVMVGDGVLMAISREPRLRGSCSSDWLTLHSAGMRLTLLRGVPSGPESIWEWIDALVDHADGGVMD